MIEWSKEKKDQALYLNFKLSVSVSVLCIACSSKSSPAPREIVWWGPRPSLTDVYFLSCPLSSLLSRHASLQQLFCWAAASRAHFRPLLKDLIDDCLRGFRGSQLGLLISWYPGWLNIRVTETMQQQDREIFFQVKVRKYFWLSEM